MAKFNHQIADVNKLIGSDKVYSLRRILHIHQHWKSTPIVFEIKM